MAELSELDNIFTAKDNNNEYINLRGSEIGTVQLTEPSISVSAISIPDDGHLEKSSYPERLAYRYPIIEINGYRIKGSDITYFVLDYSTFFPMMTLEFHDYRDAFMTTAFPRDGSIVKIYIGGQGDEMYYKPIRQDFVITNIQQVGHNPRQNDAYPSKYRISATLNIPAARRKESWSLGQLSSREELFNLATYMGLGFATNFSKSNDVDKMDWMCNQNKTLMDFTKDVAEHACYSQYSFFTAFIDQYYVLNFVEVHSLLSHGGDKKDSPAMIYTCNQQLGRPMNKDANVNGKDKKTTDEISVYRGEDLDNPTQKVSYYYITNNLFYTGWTNFIEEYHEINDGFVSMSDGYKKHLIYSDQNTGGWGCRSCEFLIPPIDNMPREVDTQKIKSFTDENVKRDTYIPLNLAQLTDPDYAELESNAVDNMCSNESIVNKGQVDTTNMFKLYYFAGVQNEYQMKNLKKCGIRVRLQNYNPAITKFSRIWVDIYEKNKFGASDISLMNKLDNGSDAYKLAVDERNKAVITFEDEGDDTEGARPNYPVTAFNRTLSGWYVVTEMKVVFNAAKMTLQTEMVLNRIEYKPTYVRDYEIAKKSVEKYKEETRPEFIFNNIDDSSYASDNVTSTES